jgi:DNA-binding PadR family transcriptional regulator
MRGHRGRMHGSRGSFFGDDNSSERMGRVLGSGDLRYLILSLLDEKPRHGYELIKAIEELSKGMYTPSPGVMYPTLSFLEDSDLASISSSENKKLYTITDTGKIFLKENKEIVEQIYMRMEKMGDKMSKLKNWMGRQESEEISREDKSPIRKAMHSLKLELFSFIDANVEKKKQIATIIESAAEEIRKLKG